MEKNKKIEELKEMSENLLKRIDELKAKNERFESENESLKLANEKLYKELEELKYYSEAKCSSVAPNYDNEQMRMLAEIRDILRKMEHEKEQEKLESRYDELEAKRKDIERDMGYVKSDIIHRDFEYWNRR